MMTLKVGVHNARMEFVFFKKSLCVFRCMVTFFIDRVRGLPYGVARCSFHQNGELYVFSTGSAQVFFFFPTPSFIDCVCVQEYYRTVAYES